MKYKLFIFALMVSMSVDALDCRFETLDLPERIKEVMENTLLEKGAIHASLSNIDSDAFVPAYLEIKKRNQGKNINYVHPIQESTVFNDTCKWLAVRAEWYYSPWSFNFIDRLAKVEIIGDTLIGDRVCSILGMFEQHEFVPGSELVTYYDRVAEKVYFFEDETFKLLYDFSFNFLPGDTLTFYLPANFELYDISSSSGSFIPTDQGYRYRFVEQQLVDLPNGDQIRIAIALGVLEDDRECFEMLRILEGIGSDRGLLGRACTQLTMGKGEFFRCFTSETMEYSEVSGECLLTSVVELIDSTVQIFPNPTRDELVLVSDHAFDVINVFNINGQLVRTFPYTERISLTNLVSGTYILELKGQKGIYRKKVIKE